MVKFGQVFRGIEKIDECNQCWRFFSVVKKVGKRQGAYIIIQNFPTLITSVGDGYLPVLAKNRL